MKIVKDTIIIIINFVCNNDKYKKLLTLGILIVKYEEFLKRIIISYKKVLH